MLILLIKLKNLTKLNIIKQGYYKTKHQFNTITVNRSTNKTTTVIIVVSKSTTTTTVSPQSNSELHNEIINTKPNPN